MTRPQLCAADVCSNPGVRHNNKLIQCYGGCDKSFHWKCIGLTAAGSSALRDNPGMFWFCENCKNNSLFRLHRKVGYICETVEATRILLRRVETNLESKIETCYNMIGNISKLNQLSYATLEACHGDLHNTAALDLSIRSVGDKAVESAADANGKRKLSEGSVDVDDEVAAGDDDAVQECPSKRKRNLQHSPSPAAEDLADLPTPTFASVVAGVTSPTELPEQPARSAVPPLAAPPVQPEPELPVQATDPVVEEPSVSTGNYTTSICPAEAGRDTAPQISYSEFHQYYVQFDDNGNVIRRSYDPPTQTTSTTYDPPTQTTSTTPNSPTIELAMDVSTSPASYLQTSAEHPLEAESVLPAASADGGISSCAPLPAVQHFVTGNCTNCICPAEAGQDTALPQGNSAPPTASNTPSSLEADASHLSGETPNSFGQPTSKRARHSASSTFRSANYSTQPGAFGTRCSSSAATVTTLPGLPTPNLVAPSAPLTFRAGNARSGICPAEAAGAAAPSFGFPTVPVFRFGSTTNRQSGSSRSASGQPQAHNAFQTSQSTLAGFHLPAANRSTAFSLAANTRVQPINNNPQSVPQQKAARPRNRKQLQPHLQPFLQPPLVQHNLAPPLQQTAPAFTCKHFYVKPFDPATTAEQIANYIQSRTGWSYDNLLRLFFVWSVL